MCDVLFCCPAGAVLHLKLAKITTAFMHFCMDLLHMCTDTGKVLRTMAAVANLSDNIPIIQGLFSKQHRAKHH